MFNHVNLLPLRTLNWALPFSVCMRSSHTGCLGIPDEQYDVIKRYKWSCIECKVCAICSQARNEEQILFCDRCDRGFFLNNIFDWFFKLTIRLSHILRCTARHPKRLVDVSHLFQVCLCLFVCMFQNTFYHFFLLLLERIRTTRNGTGARKCVHNENIARSKNIWWRLDSIPKFFLHFSLSLFLFHLQTALNWYTLL